MNNILKAVVLEDFGNPNGILYSKGDIISVIQCEEKSLTGYYWISNKFTTPEQSREAVSSDLIDIKNKIKKSA